MMERHGSAPRFDVDPLSRFNQGKFDHIYVQSNTRRSAPKPTFLAFFICMRTDNITSNRSIPLTMLPYRLLLRYTFAIFSS